MYRKKTRGGMYRILLALIRYDVGSNDDGLEVGNSISFI